MPPTVELNHASDPPVTAAPAFDRRHRRRSLLANTMRRVSDWARDTFGPGEPARYQSLPADEDDTAVPDDGPSLKQHDRISFFEYGIFLLLGCAM